MSTLVHTFRRTAVEGRFVTFPSTLVILGMRLLLFFNTETDQSHFSGAGYLWNYLAPLFADPVLSLVASTLSVLLIASLIHALNSRFALIRSRSNLPFIAPLLLLSLHPRFLVMTPDLAAVILLLLAFFPLLQSYQKQEASLYSFRSGVLIALASFFHIGALALLPLWWRGERAMRATQLRARLSYLFGMLLPGFSLFSIAFLLDDLPAFLKPFHFYADISLPTLPQFTVVEWVGLLLVVLFFFSNMVLSIRVFSRDRVLTLKLMQFLVYLIVFLLLLQLLYWGNTLFFFTLSLALTSYLNAYYFTRINAKSDVWLALVNLIVILFFYLFHFDFFRHFII